MHRIVKMGEQEESKVLASFSESRQMSRDDFPNLSPYAELDQLIEDYGNEWRFMMGSSFAQEVHEKIDGSLSRRVYWATMSTYILYDGGYKQSAEKDEGYLKIVNAERHYSFEEAIQDLKSQMREFSKEAQSSQTEDEL